MIQRKPTSLFAIFTLSLFLFGCSHPPGRLNQLFRHNPIEEVAEPTSAEVSLRLAIVAKTLLHQHQEVDKFRIESGLPTQASATEPSMTETYQIAMASLRAAPKEDVRTALRFANLRLRGTYQKPIIKQIEKDIQTYPRQSCTCFDKL